MVWIFDGAFVRHLRVGLAARELMSKDWESSYTGQRKSFDNLDWNEVSRTMLLDSLYALHLVNPNDQKDQYFNF